MKVPARYCGPVTEAKQGPQRSGHFGVHKGRSPLFHMVSIRKATIDDISHMKKIVRDAFHDDYAAAGEFYSVQQLVDQNYATQTGPYYNKDIFIEDIIRGLGEKFKEPFETFVACEDGKVVGFISMENNNGRHWVNNIFVNPEFQGQDVGRQLFDFATKGKGELWLWVNANNPAAAFWEKLGFKSVVHEKLMRKMI